MKTIFRAPLLALQFLMLALAACVDTYARRVWCFYEGPPGDLKALAEATEKAIKALQDNMKKTQDLATEALETSRKEGTIHGEQNAKLKELGEFDSKASDIFNELKTRVLEVEQKMAHKPAGGGDSEFKSMGQIVAASEQFKAAQASKGRQRMDKVDVGSFHTKATITGQLNQGTTTTSSIVMPDFRPGVVMPGLQRMTVRDLLTQNRTLSNLIVYAKELLYTSNAGPQYQVSPALTEGALKNESALTFQLANAPVVTIGHWIPASEQILEDAPMLQGYVDGRLRYGLMLEEEKELLNGNGTAGKLNGLVNQATAFTGAGTNHTAIDHILLAYLQISLSFYEPTGVVLHPTDWTNMLLLKDTLGRYLFSDPQGTTQPRLWGKDVVATPSQTQGQFLAGAFRMAAEIFDRVDATVEISKEHADFFIRNLVAILAEERLALVVYRAAAIVKGAV
jgi:HK97 family phage major capsid protein